MERLGGKSLHRTPFPFSFLQMGRLMNLSFTLIDGKPYDKLLPGRFKDGKTFTTFRAYSPRKDKYYDSCIGKEFYVLLDDRAIGKAKLIKREYRWSYDLTEEEIKNDTYNHWGRAEFNDLMNKFYENSKIFGFWLVFQITKAGQLTTLERFDDEATA